MECGLTRLNKSNLMDSILRISYPNVRAIDTLNINSVYYSHLNCDKETESKGSTNYLLLVLIILSIVTPVIFIMKLR